MAYVTWTKFADALQGEARMKALNAKLIPETVDAHPFFDSQLAIASRRADVALAKAGYETPLTTIDDPLLENAIIGLLVHYLTEKTSNREPFADALAKSALAYFAELEDGSLTVLGADVDATPEDVSLTMASPAEQPVFDTSGEADYVFARLGPFGGQWR